ncbi:MAG: DUF1566 domain-containing protein [Bacteroidota bacterium]
MKFLVEKSLFALCLSLVLCQAISAQTPKTMRRLPDTGQTQSYTNTPGEDADYTQNPPFFQLNGDGTVLDTVTGLMWQQSDGGEMTFENATTYCQNLVLGGHDDWRLPTAQEAYSILNQGKVNPALDVAVFTASDAEYWWTSEHDATNANKIWVTNKGGGVGNHLKSETVSAGGTKKIHVRAVRDLAPPPNVPSHFADNGDGTVTDLLTNLIWQKIPAPDSLTWENALMYAENLVSAGHDDWRLPNIKELQSLNDETRANPSVDPVFFPNIGLFKYWSSTTLPNQNARAWYLDTRFGITTYDTKTVKNKLLCVRGGAAIPPPPPPPTTNVSHAELLSRPTDHSITVQAFLGVDAEVCAQYGTQSGNLTKQTPWKNVAVDQAAEILIDSLNADARYFYRLCYRFPGPGAVIFRPEHNFHTQRAPGSTFTFVVQADPHLDAQSDTALYRRCLKNQLADAPDFMIDLGDFLMSDKLKNTQGKITRDTVAYRCNLLRSYYETSGHSVPLYIVLGNHEGESGWQLNGTDQNVAIYGATERKKYFRNPAPDGFYTGDVTQNTFVGQRESYYAWQWGDALFVVIDPYWYTSPKPDSLHGWRWTLGKTQYDWLKNTLETSNATFKFVFSHHLVGGDPDGRGGIEFADLYEWGGKNLNGSDGWAANRPGWYKPIKDLLTENRVTTFFHGHDHFFGKQEKDCLIYQETPQPSLPNFQNANQAADYGYFAGQFLPNAGHIRVTVSPDGVKTEYVRAYLPQNETATRHNGDVSATYFIGATNCYDSLSTGIPVLWNSNYSDELIYPNPSSGDVNITFSLAQQERISLAIYDEQGRLVRTLLADNVVPAGQFQVVWDAGSEVPNGVYFWKLQGEKGDLRGGKLVLQR